MLLSASSFFVVRFEPFQFLTKFDVAMPWIFIQTVTLAWKNQERVRDLEGLQGTFHCFPF